MTPTPYLTVGRFTRPFTLPWLRTDCLCEFLAKRCDLICKPRGGDARFVVCVVPASEGCVALGGYGSLTLWPETRQLADVGTRQAQGAEINEEDMGN
jgi:hypothetical protein